MTKNASDQQPHFYGIPATVRRNAFLQGRITIPLISPLFRVAKKCTVKADHPQHKPRDRDHSDPGGNRVKTVRAKIEFALSMGRLTRAERKRLLAQKCRAAGVTNACALALAK